MTDETIEQWAARVAPRLGADGWRHQEWFADPNNAERNPTWEAAKARALLARRDKVAATLSTYERQVLLAEAYGPPKPWGPAVGAAIGVLQANRLMAIGVGVTDFGREIARVLKGKS